MLSPPTPYWPSYLVLLRSAFFNSVSLAKKRHALSFLLGLVLFYPLGFSLYWLDKFLFLFKSPTSLRIQRPVFIVGTPRSGSTLLHRLLLDCSDDLFAITHYEWRYPSYLLQCIFSFLGLKALASTRNYWSGAKQVAATASSMHPNLMGDYEEDAILFEERVGFHPYLFLHFPETGLLSYMSGFDDSSNPAFQRVQTKVLMPFYKHVIRCVSSLRPSKSRFLSKEVASNGRIELLRKEFPDALFIFITRSPSNYLSSLKELLKISTVSKTGCDPSALGEAWWAEWLHWLAFQAESSAKAYRQLLPAKACIHVEFEDLIRNPDHVIQRLQRFLALPSSPFYQDVINMHVASQASRQKGYTYNQISFDVSRFSFFMKTFYPSQY